MNTYKFLPIIANRPELQFRKPIRKHIYIGVRAALKNLFSKKFWNCNKPHNHKSHNIFPETG